MKVRCNFIKAIKSRKEFWFSCDNKISDELIAIAEKEGVKKCGSFNIGRDCFYRLAYSKEKLSLFEGFVPHVEYLFWSGKGVADLPEYDVQTDSFKEKADEITDLQTANAQLTDRLSALEKEVKEIKKPEFILTIDESDGKDKAVAVFAELLKNGELRIHSMHEVKSQDVKRCFTTEKDSKKEFWEYVLSDKAESWRCRGLQGGGYCAKCFYSQDSECLISKYHDVEIDCTDSASMQARARKELGLEEPKKEKKLYLTISYEGELCICYGSRKMILPEFMWAVSPTNGEIRTSVDMPKLWTIWQENGCKFDPEPVKWKGMSEEKEYVLVITANGVCLHSTSNNWIMNITDRKPELACSDSNILRDFRGRAFIV